MTPIHLLLVEDNPGDVDLTLEALAVSRLALETTVVTNGTEALDYLSRRGRHAAASAPDLIFLDLNLPGVSGRQVLTSIKTNAALRHIPVIVLTSSNAESDVLESYNLGANCYVTKPVDLAGFQSTIRAINEFWFAVVKLPTQ